MKKTIYLALATALALTAYANADIGGTLSVSASVVASCEINSTASVVFGQISAGVASAGNGSIGVRCTNATTYNIALDKGGSAGTATQREMVPTSGSSLLSYALFKDPGLTQQWGDSDFANTFTDGSSKSATGSGLDQTHTVHGQVYPAFTDDIGDYTDSVVVTIIF